MGQILRFAFIGVLGLLVLLPLWSGNAADSLVARPSGGGFLASIGLPENLDSHIVLRLREVRSEIRAQRCAGGAHSYCMLKQCWTLDTPAYCAASGTVDARLGRLSRDR